MIFGADTAVVLLDNGSLEAAATLRLRVLAEELGRKIGRRVVPISLLHSSAIAAEKIDGVAAEIFEPALRKRLADGCSRFAIVPLFFGPSRALTDYLPERVAALRRDHPQLQVCLAAPLFRPDDDRLARILAAQVGTIVADLAVRPAVQRVALVDHGSPVLAVTEVRNRLAVQLAAQLGDGFVVAACSMERREGAEFDFVEPLLERLLTHDGWNRGDIVVAMQFLSAGRHAGPEGDVARICRRAEVRQPDLRTHRTALVGEHPLLVDILVDRLRGEVREL